MLAFVHMPKTGGTELTTLLRACRRRVAQVNNVRDATALAAEGKDWLGDVDAVCGHMPMSVDQLFPSIEHAVFLRDPVERLISAYAHVARVSEHPNHKLVADGMTVAEYAVSVAPEINAQVRRLADYPFVDESNSPWWTRYGRSLDPSVFEQAKANLRRCAFIGFYERFESDARLWGARFGVAIPDEVPRLNVGNSDYQIDDKSRQVFAEANALDRELYDYALTVCDKL